MLYVFWLDGWCITFGIRAGVKTLGTRFVVLGYHPTSFRVLIKVSFIGIPLCLMLHMEHEDVAFLILMSMLAEAEEEVEAVVEV